uniref:Mannosyl-glycoprotein endo-beta-N-acetylglucosaminidase n=1 Tax=Heligmosomoides polygyrus TaxID=6339 RepID=A0A183GGM8_HELPZ
LYYQAVVPNFGLFAHKILNKLGNVILFANSGCLALGTFITEWKGGAKLCDHFLETEESVKKTVDRLVAVARYFNFDGWLINIENRIRSELLRNLELFLRLLTDNMRKSAEFSRVIWYDSVTATGNLKWQNMLNGSNLRWYNSCDGIYLNYNWDDAMLLQSADFGVISRIFVGIDCFARGCIGVFADRSFAKANLMRMSVALFAPGWICEQFPHANPIENGLKFWKKLALFTPARPILELPISTDFCAGFTLFNFDVDCRACRITIQAQREVKILVNGVVKESKKEGEQIMVVIDEPIHLVSLDVCVDDFKECSLHRACIEEL